VLTWHFVYSYRKLLLKAVIYEMQCDYDNSMALVHEQTILTERPSLVGEVSANFCGYRGVTWSV
jgi:hypothetical protein